jgi:nitric oxide synthase-interacting protein
MGLLVDPVACAHGGDMFCRECALSNILAQKQEIKRLEKAKANQDREDQDQEARRDAEAKERAVREFELTQAGFDVKSTTTTAAAADSSGVPARDLDAGVKEDVAKTGAKRKFSLDEEELSRIANEDRLKVRKAMEEEKV